MPSKGCQWHVTSPSDDRKLGGYACLKMKPEQEGAIGNGEFPLTPAFSPARPGLAPQAIKSFRIIGIEEVNSIAFERAADGAAIA